MTIQHILKSIFKGFVACIESHEVPQINWNKLSLVYELFEEV